MKTCTCPFAVVSNCYQCYKKPSEKKYHLYLPFMLQYFRDPVYSEKELI